MRVPIENFDKSKLSAEGYVVLVDDVDVVLPSGEKIIDGTEFRNQAHLRFKSDIFVPCGGRVSRLSLSSFSAQWGL